VTAEPNKVVQLDRNKPYTVVVSVTPEMAERWLTNNTHNRYARDPLVIAYARDMTAGDWLMTGESIKFSTDRMLLDGQHRLRAVIRSGCTVPMFITYNLPAGAQSAMDTGARRTAADAFGLSGEKNAPILAAIIRLALGLESGNLSKYKATNAELADALATNPEFREVASFAHGVAKNLDISGSVIGYCYWRMATLDAAAAQRFWEAAAFKIGLVEGDPTLAMTSRFAQARRERENLSKETQISIIFRAWNFWRAGKMIRIMRVNGPDGAMIPIPEPR
jgi:hypothetical protein